MKRLRVLFETLLVAALLFCVLGLCAHGAEPVKAEAAQAVPFIAAEPHDMVATNGGVKKIDPPKFDMPKPGPFAEFAVGAILSIVGTIAVILFQLALFALVVIAAVCLFRRGKTKVKTSLDTLAVDNPLLHVLDTAKKQLAARHKTLQSEVAAIEKRLGVAKPVVAKKKAVPVAKS